MIGVEETESEIEQWDTNTTRLILKYKIESEQAATREKAKYHSKLAEETASFQESLAFAMKQIELKDKRIDLLMQQNERLSIMNNRMLEQFMDCPLKKGKGCLNED